MLNEPGRNVIKPATNGASASPWDDDLISSLALYPSTVSLESLIITEELGWRAARAPEFEAENEAIVGLMRALKESNAKVLQVLAETALRLSRAHSAAVSVEEAEEGRKIFRWHAAAGQWLPLLGKTVPREGSPCGVALDRRVPLLIARPERHFNYGNDSVPPVFEALLVPFEVAGETVGTVWVAAHDESRRFDGEDLRLLKNLSEFASLAFHVLRRTESVRDSLRDLHKALAGLADE